MVSKCTFFTDKTAKKNLALEMLYSEASLQGWELLLWFIHKTGSQQNRQDYFPNSCTVSSNSPEVLSAYSAMLNEYNRNAFQKVKKTKVWNQLFTPSSLLFWTSSLCAIFHPTSLICRNNMELVCTHNGCFLRVWCQYVPERVLHKGINLGSLSWNCHF